VSVVWLKKTDGTLIEATSTDAGLLQTIATFAPTQTLSCEIYGWDGAAWAEVILAAGDSDDVADTSDGLQVNARLYGYDGTAYDRIRAITAGIQVLEVDAVGCLQTAAILYAWDGVKYQRLQLTNQTNPHLKIQPFDGAGNDIDFVRTVPDNLNPGSFWGVIANSLVSGYDGSMWDRIRSNSVPDTIAAGIGNLQVTAALYGWDGSNLRRLLCVDADEAFVRTSLVNCLPTASVLYAQDGSSIRTLTMDYHGTKRALYTQLLDELGNEIRFTALNSGDNFNQSYNGIATLSLMRAYDGAAWDRVRCTGIPDPMTASSNVQTIAILYGWDLTGLRRLTSKNTGANENVLLVGIQGKNDIELRAASGTLSVNETSTPVTDIEIYNQAVIRLDVTEITTPDADDEVDFYLQTSYNGGTDWVDLENIHFDNGDNGTTAIKLLVIDRPHSSAAARTETDGTLADDTKLDLPIGDRLRWKVELTGATAPSYAYNSEASFKGN